MYDRRGREEVNLPTEDTKDKVEHEEWSDDNERNKVDPIKEAPQSVVSL